MIPRFNMHVHTLRSACAKPEMTLEAIDREASRAGLRYVGIADHIDVSEHNPRPILNREDIQNGTWDVEFLVGCEATVLSPTRMAVSDEVARSLDYVMVSANHYHLGQVENPVNRSPGDYAKHYLGMLEGVMDWGLADIIGHPFLHTKLGRRGVVDPVEVLDHYDWELVERVLERAANNELSFEIKPGYIELIPEFMGRLVKTGREYGAKFSIGTDAHRLVEIPFPEDFRSKLEGIGLGASDLIDPGDLSN
jgi:histidinol phosphatase-like PHP family hydrolase